MKDDRPWILVVEQNFRDLKPIVQTLAEGRHRLATCPVEAVALEFVAESRPQAVILDSHALYLEGAACLARWNTASPGTRVLFLDADGPWCLLMELPDRDPAHVTINPCAASQLSAAVDELLSRVSGPETRTEVFDDRMADLVV